MVLNKKSIPKCQNGRWNSIDCCKCICILKVDRYCHIFPLISLIDDAPNNIPTDGLELMLPFYRIGKTWYIVWCTSKKYKVSPVIFERTGTCHIKFQKKFDLLFILRATFSRKEAENGQKSFNQ